MLDLASVGMPGPSGLIPHAGTITADMSRQKKSAAAPKSSLSERLHHAEQVLHDHILAAEVAAEEAAAYGSVTTAVEAAEAAVDPEHELGHPDDEADDVSKPPDPKRKGRPKA
jgi:hypothetical protein